jgi:hypothetical protein
MMFVKPHHSISCRSIKDELIFRHFQAFSSLDSAIIREPRNISATRRFKIIVFGQDDLAVSSAFATSPSPAKHTQFIGAAYFFLHLNSFS